MNLEDYMDDFLADQRKAKHGGEKLGIRDTDEIVGKVRWGVTDMI